MVRLRGNEAWMWKLALMTQKQVKQSGLNQVLFSY